MATLGMQMLASALAILGWLGALLTCLLPMWRVSAYVGTTIVTSQTIWEGIWMTCIAQSTGQVMCKPYQSTLALGTDLQAARALTVMAVLAAGAGLVLAFVGGKCTRFLDDAARTKARVLVAAGGTMLAAGLLCIIPVSWTAGAVVKAFYNPQMTDSQRRELGASVYIGWGASILLFLGGGMLCSTACLKPPPDDEPSVKYVLVRSSANGSSKHTPVASVRSQPLSAATGRQPLRAGPPGSYAPSRVGSEPSQAASTKSQLKRPLSMQSEVSEGPSTKSQLQRAFSAQSEVSEGPSTKSELKRADSAKSLDDFAKSQLDETAAFTDEPSKSPTQTYI